MIGDPNNDSNLAAKAIIALKAYGDLLASIDRDGTAYSDTAANYATSWLSSAVSPSGIQSDYGTSDTWTMAPNLFADKWLKANVFPDDLYQAIGSFYLLHLGEPSFPFIPNSVLTVPKIPLGSLSIAIPLSLVHVSAIGLVFIFATD